MHICVHKINYAITGEDDGVTPVRCEAVIRTRDGLLSAEQTSVKFAPEYDRAVFQMMLRISSAQWQNLLATMCSGKLI